MKKKNNSNFTVENYFAMTTNCHQDDVYSYFSHGRKRRLTPDELLSLQNRFKKLSSKEQEIIKTDTEKRFEEIAQCEYEDHYLPSMEDML